MNKEQLKALVKAHFNLVEREEVVETVAEKFAEATLVDGTQITNDSADDFAIGQTLYVVTEDGSKVIAPVGEHTTEDGTAIVVDEYGVITGIHKPDQAPEGSLAIAEEQMAEEEGIVAPEAAPVSIEDVVKAVIDTVKPEIELMKTKLADMEEKMKSYFAQPAAEKTQPSKFAKEATKQPIADKVNAHMYEAALTAIKNKKK